MELGLVSRKNEASLSSAPAHDLPLEKSERKLHSSCVMGDIEITGVPMSYHSEI